MTSEAASLLHCLDRILSPSPNDTSADLSNKIAKASTLIDTALGRLSLHVAEHVATENHWSIEYIEWLHYYAPR